MVRGRAFMLLLCFFASLPITDETTIGSHCVQFGLGAPYFGRFWDYGHNLGFMKKPGMWTIATKPFDCKWIAALTASWQIDFEPALINVPDREAYDRIMISQPDDKCPWKFAPTCTKIVLPPAVAAAQPYPYPVCAKPDYVKVRPCVPNSLARINMYLVKQKNRILQGWVHVEIELLDTTDEIELLYIQMRDEAHNAIGEFLTPDIVPGASCKPSKNYLSTPTQYQFYPCSAVGLREAKTSQGLMMAKQEFYLNPDPEFARKYLHKDPINRGIHFLWRFGEYWCSRHQKIQPFAHILTKRNRVGYEAGREAAVVHMWRKIPGYWIHPKWFGASDILFKHGEKLDCSELIIDDDTGVVTPAASNSWIRTSSPVLFKEDSMNPRNHVNVTSILYTNNICQANPFIRTGSDATIPTFSGRCASYTAKITSRSTFQGCNTDPNASEFEGVDVGTFTIYDKYLDQKQTNRLQFCNLNCTTPKDVDDILAYPALNDTEEDVKPKYIAGKTDPRTRARTVKLRAGRRYHGILFSFIAFLITPVFVFTARYYKETFLRRRCYGVHMWYWTHIGGIVATFCLGSSGHAALTPFYRIWGRSTTDAGVLHRTFGYGSMGSFLFLVVFGGFRIRAPGIGRILSITLHALVGFAHHWLNQAAVIYSTWIPMSPSLKYCDHKGLPFGLSPIFWLAFIWIGVDLLFHLFLTVMHVHRDRVIGIWREWYFPIVPLAQNEQMTDMPGGGLRKLLLFIYIAIALAMAVASSCFIIYHDMPKHCDDTGTTTCKHIFGCTEIAIKYETWYFAHGGT